NTVVAAGVEGEEVARSVVPSRRGRGDLALANIAGTIVHFAALNAGVIALVRPLGLNSDSLHLHLPVAVGASALLSALIGLRGGPTPPRPPNSCTGTSSPRPRSLSTSESKWCSPTRMAKCTCAPPRLPSRPTCGSQSPIRVLPASTQTALRCCQRSTTGSPSS